MKSLIRTFTLAALVLFVFLAVPNAHAAKKIKVGIIDTYSGPASTYTVDVRDAFAMAAQKINSQGGILGREIEFVTRDDKFKVDIGLSAAKQLLMRENIDVLMGTINSALSLAISDLAMKEKVPFLVTFGKSDKITGEKGNRYTFSMNENTAMIGKAAAVALAKLPYTNYWIAGDDYEYGHAIAEGVWENLKKIKPEVQLLGESWWKVGEPDFNPYITAMLAAKPDAVIVATGGRSCVPFLKTAKATGFNEQVPFYMHTATELSTLKPLGLDAPEGVLGTANYHNYFPATEANQAFAAEFEKTYGRTPAAGALYGYITAQFIAKAYEKAGEIDAEKFIDALEGLSVDSPIGEVTMRSEDHQVMLPMYMGKTRKVAGQNVLTASDIVTIPAEDLMPDLEEIRKARGK